MKYLRTKRLIQHTLMEIIGPSESDEVLVLPGISGVEIFDFIEKNPNTNITAIECDPMIASFLRSRFDHLPNVNIVCEDMLEYLKSTNKQFDVIFLDTFSKWGSYLKLVTDFCIHSKVLKVGGHLGVNFVGNRETRSESLLQEKAAFKFLNRPTNGSEERRIYSVISHLKSNTRKCDSPNFYLYKSGKTNMLYFHTIKREKATEEGWDNMQNKIQTIQHVSVQRENYSCVSLETNGKQEIKPARKELTKRYITQSEAVKEGLRKAKKAGKRIGRPPIPENIVTKVLALRNNGLSIRAIAKALDGKISKSAVERIINPLTV